MTGWYHRLVVPRLTDLACGLSQIEEQRRKIVPQASGRVLEVGIGSGHNLPFYDCSRVEHVYGIDPSGELLDLARKRSLGVGFGVSLQQARAEAIPLETSNVDTAVSTYTLCTVEDPLQVLREIARVLKPGGRLLLAEHGKTPEAAVGKWQTRLTPIWKRLAAGCHLDRDVPELLRRAGFGGQDVSAGYIEGPKVVSFNFVGSSAPSKKC